MGNGCSRQSLRTNYPVRRIPGLYVNHRGRESLVVDPASASWAVIPRAQYDILEGMNELRFFQELCEENPSLTREGIESLIDRFFDHGMVEVNWKRRFADEKVMWAPQDDYPVYPRDFYFHTTDACNFRCSYCYADSGDRTRTMSLSTMKSIIERVFREIPHNDVSFVFHGGEPLLLRDRIFQAIEYAEKTSRRYNKRAFYSFQTNGSLIDREVIEYALRYHMDVGVTLDGPQELHDTNRFYPDGSGTFNDVWRASQQAIRQGVHLGYICIVHEPQNYRRAFEFFVSRGIFSFNVRYSFAVGRAAETYEFSLEKGREMALGLLSMLELAVEFHKKTGIRLKINDLDSFISHLISKRRNYMCMRSPCGIGRSIVAFGPDGELYPCEEMSPYRDFSFGSIQEEKTLTEIIDHSESLRKLRERRVENIEKCSTCPWRRFCMGRCTHKTVHYFGDAMREDPSCSFFSTIFEELMWMIARDKTVLDFT